jgi:hypothetical protein
MEQKVRKMANLKEIEGTWEELSARADEFAGHRLKLIVLPKEEIEVGAAEQSDTPQEEKTLAELFAGRVGRFHFGEANLSQDTGKKFAALMAEKKRQGRL